MLQSLPELGSLSHALGAWPRRNMESFIHRLMRGLDALCHAHERSAPMPTQAHVPDELTRLVERLGLAEEVAWLLALALAPRFSTEVALLYGKLRGTAHRSALTDEILAVIEKRSVYAVHQRYHQILSGSGLAFRLGILERQGDALYPTSALRTALFGRTHVPESMASYARSLRVRSEPWIFSERVEKRVRAVESLWSGDGHNTPLTYLLGPPGVGRSMVAQTLALAVNLALIEVRTDRMPASSDVLELTRESIILHAGLLFRFNSEEWTPEWMSRIEACILRDVPVLVELPPTCRPLNSEHRATVCLELPAPGFEERCALWSRYLPRRLRARDVTDAELSFRFRGHGRSIADLSRSAIDQLSAELEPQRKVTRQHLEEVAHRSLSGHLSGLATLCDPLPHGLKKLALDGALKERFEGLVARVRHRRTVMAEWGFGEASYGLGTIVLMSGPPGTGKTLGARALCSELGIPLYRIDLSRIVSKWVGETEKHLEALFGEAEACGAALLFDEADALFSKRSEVRSANDHHANLQVGFLLQRIESFDGVCFLTTNMCKSIDAAFIRRMTAHLRFDLPEAEQRAHIWRAVLPARAPLHDDVDLIKLASAHPDVSGGEIRNAATEAAFVAAAQGSPITQRILQRAIIQTQQAGGALVRDLDD